MKSKAKFDPKVIQQFCIDHTEKFVVGLVAVLFLYFAYQSVTLDKYKRSPEELKKATDAAMSKIASGPATKKAAEVEKFPEYASDIDKFKKPIESGEYPMPPRLFWGLFRPLRLRDAPAVYPVEQLRAVAGRGAIYKSDGNNAGGASTQGRRWVLLTGLVPYKRQLAEYHEKFVGSALETTHDEPRYAGYFVQRAEVTSGEPGEPKWSKFTIFNDANAAAAKWGGRTAEDIADPRVLHPTLTSPLPAVAGATWGIEAVSPPQIPVTQRPANQPAVPGHGMQMTWGPRDAHRGPPVGGGFANPGAGPAPNAGGANLLGGSVPKPAADKPAKEEEAEVPEYLLLRYFDFDVEPDKQYQYRIFLVLENPNYDATTPLPVTVLDEAELGHNPLIGPKGAPVKNAAGEIVDWPTNPAYAKWSAPSNVTSRGAGDMRVLCGNVVAAKGLEEIKAQVRVLLWLEKSGRNGSCTKENLIRGAALTFPDAAFKIPGEAKPTVVHPLDLKSVLVDLQGGDPAANARDKTLTPGMILVMDETGNLVMHDEVAEAKEWEEATKEPEKPAGTHGPGDRGVRDRPPERGVNSNDLDPGNVRQRHGR